MSKWIVTMVRYGNPLDSVLKAIELSHMQLPPCELIMDSHR